MVLLCRAVSGIGGLGGFWLPSLDTGGLIDALRSFWKVLGCWVEG